MIDASTVASGEPMLLENVDSLVLCQGHTSANGQHAWNANLNLLQSDGMARVLAEPTLVALSGQSASFLSGGELPIPEPQGLGTTTIVYKPFGIGLTVTPTVLAPDRIALKVAPEASDLDYTNAVVLNGVSVPAISTRRADTTVELGDGIALARHACIASAPGPSWITGAGTSIGNRCEQGRWRYPAHDGVHPHGARLLGQAP